MICIWNGLDNCGKGALVVSVMENGKPKMADGKRVRRSVKPGESVDIDPKAQKPAVAKGLKPKGKG